MKQKVTSSHQDKWEKFTAFLCHLLFDFRKVMKLSDLPERPMPNFSYPGWRKRNNRLQEHQWAFGSLSLEDVRGPGINFEFLFYVRTVVLCKSHICFALERTPRQRGRRKGYSQKKKKTWTQSCKLFNQCKAPTFIPHPLDNKAQSVPTISFMGTSEGTILGHSELEELKA